MARIGADTILGQEVEIYAYESGTWEIKLDEGETIGDTIGRGDTLLQAKSAARTTLNKRKVKVEVKFRTPDGGHGVATGIHQRSRTILVHINGRPDQLRGNGSETAYQPETPIEDLARIGEIDRQQRALRDERAKLHRKYSFDLRSAVTRAIETAAASAE